jgi:hypothetical protein
VVSDVEKAKRYSEERDRIKFVAFDATFDGTNSTHQVNYHEGVWNCTCDFFKSRGVCCHTMALERLLSGMITAAVPISVA